MVFKCLRCGLEYERIFHEPEFKACVCGSKIFIKKRSDAIRKVQAV